MKKLVILFTFCFATTLTCAIAGNPVEAPKKSGFSLIQKGSLLKVLYKGFEKSNIKINIRDSRNREIFSETVRKTDGFVRPYNLAHLDDGQYTIEVVDGSGANSQSVIVKKHEEERKFHLMPVTNQYGKVMLMVGRDARSFQITFRNADGELLLEEEKIIDTDFAKVYDLSVLKDHVVITVKDEFGNSEVYNF